MSEKEFQKKVHELLYNNLRLLTSLYPASSAFKHIFRSDMFMKSNKAAFHEVVYYLLNILNPELTRKKLSWPLYDIKIENKFRAEVVQYINDLNKLYDNIHIPPIMPSHLISPGGFKFAFCMLKLSELVIHEHLRNINSSVLGYPKPNRNNNITETTIKHLTLVTRVIESECQKSISNFENCILKVKEKAERINEMLSEYDKKIEALLYKSTLRKEENNQKYPHLSIDYLKEKFDNLKQEWESLTCFIQLFQECKPILNYLKNDELVLKYDKDKLIIPKEISHFIRSSRDTLDLIELFKGLNILLERELLELPYPTFSFITNHQEKLDELNGKYLRLEMDITSRQEKFQQQMVEISETLKLFETSVLRSASFG